MLGSVIFNENFATMKIEPNFLVENVLIIGASKFLGQHLVRELVQNWTGLKRVNILDEEDYVKILDYDEGLVEIKPFKGSLLEDANLLEKSLENIQAVFHLFEHKSYALFPDDKKFHAVNVQGTKFILEQCAKVGSVKYFIYGSAFEIMVASDWPSVHSPEIARIPYGRWAFPGYSVSKLDAEELIFNADHFHSVAVRLAPMYGEMDVDSWVVDQLKKAAKSGGVLTVFGDRDNVMQHIYVGNAAYGMVKILKKLTENLQVTKECTFLVDDSPLRDLYRTVEPFLAARNYVFSQKNQIPFLVFYAAYVLFEKTAKSINKFVRIEGFFDGWRSSSYFYTFFHNWVFFKNLKCHVFFGYTPRYTFEECVEKCRGYYAGMKL